MLHTLNMKGTILILIVSFGLVTHAQTISSRLFPETERAGAYDSEHLLTSGSVSGFPQDDRDGLYPQDSERMGIYNPNAFTKPVVPVLTTDAAHLEICTGNSTRLTASSNYPIYWYTTPPPLGIPVGTGSFYVTPELSTGYYTYYAVADNNGIKSDITAMEVIMVYPKPVLNIVSSAPALCSGENATLTVSGTTYYEWENGPVSPQLVIKPQETRSFKVTGVNTAGCSSTAVYTQLVESCTASAEEELSTLSLNSSSRHVSNDLKQDDPVFSVFPNPNHGAFNIQVSSISETTRVEIYNSLGALVYNSLIADETLQVDLHDYPDGIYIVRIAENDRVLKQQKVIKE